MEATDTIRPEWVDEIVCAFSMASGHGFDEEDLEELVLSLTTGLNEKLAKATH